MAQRIFLAGATGAIGAALVPLLREAGYAVYGSTRRVDRAALLEDAGITPVVVDVYDAAALSAEVARVAPTAVIHQLTDLPPGLNPSQMADSAYRNARVRDEGTRNLVAAALAAGCSRFIAQSIAWAYAPGALPYTESSPLDLDAAGMRAVSVGGVAALERQVLETPGLAGTVLRYGNIYGPGTGRAAPEGPSPVHVEAAAWAALLALQRAATGAFNVAEPGGEASSERAVRELSWDPSMRVVRKAS